MSKPVTNLNYCPEIAGLIRRYKKISSDPDPVMLRFLESMLSRGDKDWTWSVIALLDIAMDSVSKEL